MLAVVAVAAVGCSTPTSSAEPPESSMSSDPVLPTPVGDEHRYLASLREQHVPISESGSAEVQIGNGVCAQILAGADPKALARDLTVLGWTAEQTTAIVETAKAHLCP